MGYEDGEAVLTILTKTGVFLQSNSEGFEVKIQSETRTWHDDNIQFNSKGVCFFGETQDIFVRHIKNYALGKRRCETYFILVIVEISKMYLWCCIIFLSTCFTHHILVPLPLLFQRFPLFWNITRKHWDIGQHG